MRFREKIPMAGNMTQDERERELMRLLLPKYARQLDGRAGRVVPPTPSLGDTADQWGDLAWAATGIPQAQSGIEDLGKGTLPGALSGIGKIGGAAVGYLPFAGPISRGVSAAVTRAPVRTGLAVGAGGVGLMPDEADARDGKQSSSPSTQRRIDMLNAQTRAKADAEAAQQENARKDAAARSALEREDIAAKAKLQSDLAEAERNKTFAQKYPEWADALPGIGVGLSMGVPLFGKMLSQGIRNAPVKQWNQSLKGADEAAAAGQVQPLNDNLAKLAEFNGKMPGGVLPPAGGGYAPYAAAAGFGGAAGMEVRAFPDQWNAYNLPDSNPERAASRERMTDLGLLWKSGALGAAAGLGGYKAGQWVAPDKLGPAAASQGMVARYGAGTGDDAAAVLSRDAFRQHEINAVRGATPAPPTLTAPTQPTPLGLMNDLPKPVPALPPPSSAVPNITTNSPATKTRFDPAMYGMGGAAAASAATDESTVSQLSALVRAGLLPPSVLAGFP